jgi:hypothetical protein
MRTAQQLDDEDRKIFLDAIADEEQLVSVCVGH